MYRINTVVDINNLISLESLCSVGSYDLANVEQEVNFRVGLPQETYRGIGKDIVNLEGLPVLADRRGPFGSPISDSARAMITDDSKQVAIVVISFSGIPRLEGFARRAASLLQEYAEATEVGVAVVR